MDLTWFKDLEQLSKTGNFSQAAQIRNISQPAFSRRIKALEAWVGTGLVNRNRHPISLTQAGAQMLEASIQVFERLEYERSQILEAETVPDKYVVTFGAQHSIGWRFFPAWLQSFENAYGPIISRLRADDLPNCVLALQNCEVDFVIAYESVHSRALGTVPAADSILIGTDRLVPVCKPGSDGKPLFDLQTTSDGPKTPWLRFGENAPIAHHVEPLLNDLNLTNRLSVVYENSMTGALRIRAREGAGIAWLPYSLILPDLEAGLLAEIDNENWKIDLDIKLYRNNQHTNVLTRKIWDYLGQEGRGVSL